MKKTLFVIIITCFLFCFLTGCKTTIDTDNHKIFYDKFVVIETRDNPEYGTLYIVYDKDTMVMYYYLDSTYNHNLCPVYDADGNVSIYSEDQ